MSAGSSIRTLAAPAFLVTSILLTACWAGRPPGFEQERLERIEDLSESLANDLLALSAATKSLNLPSMRRYFAVAVRSAHLPVRPDVLTSEVKWIHRHGWTGGAQQRTLPRDAFLEELRVLLDHFQEIEDVRFGVQQAEFEDAGPSEGRAAIKMSIVGRDPEGRREWLQALLRIDVRKEGEEPWGIQRLEVESIESLVASTDLFSEVAVPAGVSAFFPPFGVTPNSGFVSHGAAAGDVNNDGLLDLAATGVEQNYLYLNLGDGRFRDVSASSAVQYVPIGSGAVFLDYDGDGDADLFLAAVGNQVLLENRWIPDGEVAFWDVSERAWVDVPAVGFSAAVADVNGDGRPDIYVASYNHYGAIMPNAWHRATNGTPNLLFINQGDGSFRQEAKAWGVDDRRWTYAAAFADLDRDGDQDLYSSNDFGENALYRNDGGRFTDIAAEAGVLDPGFSMGASFGDYDNDGDLDLHVTNISSTAGQRILQRLYPAERQDRRYLAKLAAGNSLYENLGDGTFRDRTSQAGGFAAGWAFGGGFVDFDNDGWEDVYAPNGFISGKSMNDT
jgi:hypothetical protein